MATAVRGWQGFRAYLEMIKIEHSVFALPFALIGLLWASADSRGSLWPGWKVFSLVLLAMVSCRSAAMAFNRIVDRQVDGLNPRTRLRALPAGILSLRTANLYLYASCGLFVLAAALLNPLAFALSPVALLVTLGYSVTKRFTPMTHFILGLSLGIAPAAAYVAVAGAFSPKVLPLVAAVGLWTAGFDIIYSLQDEGFDREHGLRSLPESLGPERALLVSRLCHLLAVGCLGWAFAWAGVGAVGYLAVLLAACLLAYEQSLVRPPDLSRVNTAFFTLNGFVSIGVFVLFLADRLVSRA